MKINYIAFLDPHQHPGGGEMILRELLSWGLSRGHDLKVSSASPWQLQLHSQPDLTIFADLFNCPQSETKLPGPWLQAGMAGAYVHLDTAYVDCCNLDYLPCSGESHSPCPHKKPWHLKRNLQAKDFGGQCFARSETVQRLYNDSLMNVFLSPLHYETVKQVVGFDDTHPRFLLRPMIDTRTFNNKKQTRDIPHLFAGVYGEAKGAAELETQYSDKEIHFIGSSTGPAPSYGVHHGVLPAKEVADTMNRTEEFVFLPRWPEPQGRVVVEAALCGCKLNLNPQVGAASYNFDLTDPQNSTGAAGEFWDKIEGLV